MEQAFNCLRSVPGAANGDDYHDNECFILFFILRLDCFALKMEALRCFETFVIIYKWTSYNIPENVYLQKSIFDY